MIYQPDSLSAEALVLFTTDTLRLCGYDDKQIFILWMDGINKYTKRNRRRQNE